MTVSFINVVGSQELSSHSESVWPPISLSDMTPNNQHHSGGPSERDQAWTRLQQLAVAYGEALAAEDRQRLIVVRQQHDALYLDSALPHSRS
jgi:hypothetical protein